MGNPNLSSLALVPSAAANYGTAWPGVHALLLLQHAARIYAHAAHAARMRAAMQHMHT